MVSKECGRAGWGEVDIRLARIHDSAYTTCAKAFITYIRVTVRASSVLAVDVFGTGVFHLHLVP
jgi:hypothetical protein